MHYWTPQVEQRAPSGHSAMTRGGAGRIGWTRGWYSVGGRQNQGMGATGLLRRGAVYFGLRDEDGEDRPSTGLDLLCRSFVARGTWVAALALIAAAVVLGVFCEGPQRGRGWNCRRSRDLGRLGVLHGHPAATAHGGPRNGAGRRGVGALDSWWAHAARTAVTPGRPALPRAGLVRRPD